MGERVVFPSGKNFDLNLAALSADGRAAVLVEIRPLTLENHVYAERLYRWREEAGIELLAERRGGTDAFVAKYAPDGSLAWATLFGNGGPLRGDDSDFEAGYELGRGVAMGADGGVYLAGTLLRSALATTPGAAVPSPLSGAHDRDGFVVKLGAAGDRVEFATYLAFTDRFGARPGEVNALALGPDGSAYVAGDVDERDAFALRLSPDGTRIDYSVHIGCCVQTDPGIFGDPGIDHAAAIAVDGDGRAYVTGFARGSAFPAITAGAYQTAFGGLLDAYAARLEPDGALDYLSYLGGAGDDAGLAIAADPAGRAFVAGASWSADFPAVPAAPEPRANCALCGDGFLTVIGPGGRTAPWSARLGGRLEDALGALVLASEAAGVRIKAYGGTRSPDVEPPSGAEWYDGDMLAVDVLVAAELEPDHRPIYLPIARAGAGW